MSEIESWKPLIILFVVTIIFGIFVLSRSQKFKIINLSRSILFTVMAYSLLSVTIFLISGSIIQAILSQQYQSDFGYHKILTFSNLPIIETKIFDIVAFCIDLLSLLALLTTLIIFFISFVFSQVSLHMLAKRLENDSLTTKAEIIKKQFPWLNNANVRIIVVENTKPDAFSFSLIHINSWNLNIEDIIVISTGLVHLINNHELEAVLAHEYSHVLNHDSRYSHLLFTLSSVLFFDPVYRIFNRYLFKKQEFRADISSAKLVKKPRSLAKALYKLLVYSNANPNYKKVSIPTTFFGRSDLIVIERIKRLLTYAKTNNLDL